MYLKAITTITILIFDKIQANSGIDRFYRKTHKE